MNIALLQTVLQNKHTTAAGAAYVIASGIPKLAATLTHIWSPGHEQQVHDTCQAFTDWIKPIALLYGLTMAGDAGNSKRAIENLSQRVDTVENNTQTFNAVPKQEQQTTKQ